MTLHHRRRTDPVTTHAYTVPVVREVPHRPGLGAAFSPNEPGQPLAYAAGSQDW